MHPIIVFLVHQCCRLVVFKKLMNQIEHISCVQVNNQPLYQKCVIFFQNVVCLRYFGL